MDRRTVKKCEGYFRGLFLMGFLSLGFMFVQAQSPVPGPGTSASGVAPSTQAATPSSTSSWKALLDKFTQASGHETRYQAALALQQFVQGHSQDVEHQQKAADSLNTLINKETDQEVLVPLLEASFQLSGETTPLNEMEDLFKSAQGIVKFRSALALVDMGDVDNPSIIDLLKKYDQGDSSSSETRLAQAYLRIIRLNKDMEQVRFSHPNYKFDYRLIDEILQRIKESYVTKSKVNTHDLIESCASGIVSSLDPFSSFLNEKSQQQLLEAIGKKYAGIGAYVSMRDGWLTIEKPVYSGPAYKAGLRSLDRITQIGDVLTKDKAIEELVTSLKGNAGSPVHIKVYRKGWDKERDFTIVRQEIHLGTANGALIPSGIGYINVSSFSETTPFEIYQQYQSLIQENGGTLKGLILDLRNDPGGYLVGATESANLFIEPGKLLLSARGDRSLVSVQDLLSMGTSLKIRSRHKGTEAEKDIYSTPLDNKIFAPMGFPNPTKITLQPIVVLINEGTASAAEIFSGILHDYHKAVVVGVRSFGKGTVQKLFDLQALNQKGSLRLTIAHYYLPKGESDNAERTPEGVVLKEGGIVPDRVVKPLDPDYWVYAQREKLLDSGLVDQYVAQYYPDHKKQFDALAVNDQSDYKEYPEFKSWYVTLPTQLDKNQVREVLRYAIRRRVQDDQGKELLYDLVDDNQLQAAIREILKERGENLKALSSTFYFLAQKPEGGPSLKPISEKQVEGHLTSPPSGKTSNPASEPK